MPLRYDQRQHIIRSLDNVVYQLITLSFMLSPSLVSYFARTLFQFHFSRPRELDPKRSLLFWYFLILLFNGPSVWSHATVGAARGRSVLLDFVGQASPPSKLHLLLLDVGIISLNMVLTSIAYETTLQTELPEDIPDPLLPIPNPSTSPSPLFNESNFPETDTPYALDLRLRQIVDRLKGPTPPVPERSSLDDILPLPISTPWRFTSNTMLRARARARAAERERPRPANDANASIERDGVSAPATRRTIPGGLDEEDMA